MGPGRLVPPDLGATPEKFFHRVGCNRVNVLLVTGVVFWVFKHQADHALTASRNHFCCVASKPIARQYVDGDHIFETTESSRQNRSSRIIAAANTEGSPTIINGQGSVAPPVKRIRKRG